MDRELYTLEEAKDFLRDHIGTGIKCPCCSQLAREYKYSFHKGMAKCLYLIDKGFDEGRAEGDWLHVENYFVEIGVKMKGYHGKLKHWGLLEQRDNTDERKAKSGYWRLTDKGKAFLNGEITVPNMMILFNDEVRGHGDKLISINDKLENFNYSTI